MFDLLVYFLDSVAAADKGGLAVQACDDFLDELLSHEVGGEGRVPDIRCLSLSLLQEAITFQFIYIIYIY